MSQQGSILFVELMFKRDLDRRRVWVCEYLKGRKKEKEKKTKEKVTKDVTLTMVNETIVTHVRKVYG